MNPNLLSTAGAAAYLNAARQTLAVWRLTGTGPAYKKIGRKVVYDVAELDRWLAARTYRSTSEY